MSSGWRSRAGVFKTSISPNGRCSASGRRASGRTGISAYDRTTAASRWGRRRQLRGGYGIMCLAVPGKIVRILDEEPLSRLGEVSFSGVRKEVSLAFVPEAGVGDYVIVHAGFAISTLNEEEAREALRYVRQLDEAPEGGDGP